ncbi:MAG: helix-turn-helix domain-containing protein [Xanthobacteraceae bacterium]
MIDRERIVALCDEGMPDSVIAREIGCVTETVRRVLRERRPDRPRRPHWRRQRLKARAAHALSDAGFQQNEIGKVLGLKPHQVSLMMSAIAETKNV